MARCALNTPQCYARAEGRPCTCVREPVEPWAGEVARLERRVTILEDCVRDLIRHVAELTRRIPAEK